MYIQSSLRAKREGACIIPIFGRTVSGIWEKHNHNKAFSAGLWYRIHISGHKKVGGEGLLLHRSSSLQLALLSNIVSEQEFLV